MIDREATLAARGREVDWHLATPEDLIDAAGEPGDRAAVDRATTAVVRYVAYTADDPPRTDAALEVLRDALKREQAFADPAATAAAVAAAERVMAAER
jgi:hypothetical protein